MTSFVAHRNDPQRVAFELPAYSQANRVRFSFEESQPCAATLGIVPVKGIGRKDSQSIPLQLYRSAFSEG